MNRQLTCQETKIVEKIVKNQDKVYLARFLVVNTAGNIQWKLLDLVEVPEQNENGEILLLVGAKIKQIYSDAVTYTKETVSPYFDLLFFISQPTRAPNFN